MNIEYNDVVNAIMSDFKADEISLATTDEKASLDPGSDKEQYNKRNDLYTNLLSKYIDVYKGKTIKNKTYKAVFFWTTISLLILIVGASLTALIIAAVNIRSEVIWASITLTVSSMTGLVSSIIVLPKIIANHLFPTNEDKNMIDMVKSMQENDSQIRKHINYKNTPT